MTDNMKKGLFWKVLVGLALLVALGYFVTTPDSEVMIERPWLGG